MTESRCVKQCYLEPKDGVRAFLKIGLCDIKTGWIDEWEFDHGLGNWPTEEQLNELCKYANGEYTRAVEIVQSFSCLGWKSGKALVDALLENVKKLAEKRVFRQ